MSSAVCSDSFLFLLLFSDVTLLPNLEKFTLQDQVDEYVLCAVRVYILTKKLTELTIMYVITHYSNSRNIFQTFSPPGIVL